MHGPACIFWANLTAFSLQGLHDPDGKTAAATERYLAVVKQGGGRSEAVVLALAPKPAEAVSSAASECKT